MNLKDLNFYKIRKNCRIFRTVLGVCAIAAGLITGINWFYLGIIPLIAGITNFCPLCIITKKCDIPNKQRD